MPREVLPLPAGLVASHSHLEVVSLPEPLRVQRLQLADRSVAARPLAARPAGRPADPRAGPRLAVLH